MRYVIGIVCVFLAGIVFAQPPAPMGTLALTVKFEDGMPAGQIYVTLSRKNMRTFYSYSRTTDDGAFVAMAPAGEELTVRVGKAAVTVTLTEGETTPLAITLPDSGVEISVAFPDGAPAVARITVESRSPGGEEYPRAACIAPGRYRLFDVPADCTELSVEAIHGEELTHSITTAEWKFDARERPRYLALTVPQSMPFVVEVRDDRDQRLINTPMMAMVTRIEEDWQEEHFLPDLVTDAEGHLNIGSLSPGTYRLVLWHGERAGDIVPFEAAEGRVTLDRYAIGTVDRRVEQALFTANATPAREAEVFASYAWGGRWVLRRAMSDAAGRVVWETLPPAPAIIWGKNIPAGVLSPDATAVAAPLPPVQRGEEAEIRLFLPDNGLLAQGLRTSHGESYPTTSGTPRSASPYTERHCQYTVGEPFRHWAVPRHSTQRIAVLDHVYPPLVEKDEVSRYFLAWQECGEVRGRFVDAAGRPVAGVSRLALQPLDPESWPAMMSRSLAQSLGFLTISEQGADGSFRAVVPFPGRYRLLLDLYDESVPPPPALVVNIEPGLNTVTVTLPPPLLTVPAGAFVQWITRNAPADARGLLASAWAPTVPIYGSRDEVLACWHRPTPDELVIWNALDAERPLTRRSLRSAEILVTDPGEKPRLEPVTLHPLLPVSVSEGWRDGNPGQVFPEMLRTRLRGVAGYRANLWPGTYAVFHDWNPREQRQTGYIGLLAISDQGTGAVQLPVDAEARWPAMDALDNIPLSMQFPREVDYAALRVRGAQHFTVRFDCAPFIHQSIAAASIRVVGREGYDMSIWNPPAQAKTLSVQWLGVGVIPDVSIPTPAFDGKLRELRRQPVALPPWQPGLTVSGVVLAPDGKPLAGRTLAIGSRLRQFGKEEYIEGLKVTTDEEGRFAVKGVLPGPLFVMLLEGEGKVGAGWTLTVPETGLTGAILRATAKPIAFYEERSGGAMDHRSAWWFPDDGKALQLPMIGDICASHELRQGSGRLWIVGRSRGQATLLRIMLRGTNHTRSLSEMQHTRIESPLGLIFPFDAEAGIPGAVTLIGEEELAGIRVIFVDLFWQPCPELGITVGQLRAVPPGRYRVIVETPRGPVEAPVTVTPSGGSLSLQFPEVRK